MFNLKSAKSTFLSKNGQKSRKVDLKWKKWTFGSTFSFEDRFEEGRFLQNVLCYLQFTMVFWKEIIIIGGKREATGIDESYL